MGEIPAEWLEKSAADAARKMKPGPYDGQKGIATVDAVQMNLAWHRYGSSSVKTPNGKPFFCIVQLAPGSKESLQIYVHDRVKRRYWFNVMTGDCKAPETASYWTEVPESFLQMFPIELHNWR